MPSPFGMIGRARSRGVPVRVKMAELNKRSTQKKKKNGRNREKSQIDYLIADPTQLLIAMLHINVVWADLSRPLLVFMTVTL
ncbi:hypothetical protein CDAR_611701 [Caerostris darwini]|uniref:Uncharacterized protein n=1 Tax=Caerostris darwini TaxID=1538125 RepID=A0AAV4U2W6_9ARAC|nr:hypothetical protein CDAR_611701 [Caerostris darwini]